MRLIVKSLWGRKRGVLEYASYNIFSHFSWLDEPKAAVCHRVFAWSSKEHRDDSAKPTNRVMKQQLDVSGKKLRLSNVQRRSLAKKAKALGWAILQRYASLVTPTTLMAWDRRFVALKYTGKRESNIERQGEMEVIRELCVKFAEENPDWGYNRIQEPFPVSVMWSAILQSATEWVCRALREINQDRVSRSLYLSRRKTTASSSWVIREVISSWAELSGIEKLNPIPEICRKAR